MAVHLAQPKFSPSDLRDVGITEHKWCGVLVPYSAPFHLGITSLGSRHTRSCALATVESGTSAGFFRGTSIPDVITQSERQELLWKELFLDPAEWWDNRQTKRSSRDPDFRHKKSKRALWLDNLCKPAWVNLQLAAWDAQLVDATSGNDCGPYTGALPEANLEVRIRSELCEDGQLTKVVEGLELLVQLGSHASETLLYRVLKRCIAERNLFLGRRVHAVAVRGGYESNGFLATHTIRMYASHGRLEEARHVFTKVAAPDTYVWASIIFAYAEHGQPQQAIKLYRQMRHHSVMGNSYVFAAVLKACGTATDFASGKEVHADILGTSVESDTFVGNCVVDMYAKCGSLVDARRVFDALEPKNVVTWNAMIGGYAHHGLGQEALALYSKMLEDAVIPADRVTFVCLLKACSSTGSFHEGKKIHSQILERRLESDVVVGNCLVDMYAKCGMLGDARSVFDSLHTKDVVSWTAVIAGHVQQGMGQEALSLYASMLQDGISSADCFLFSCLVKACASIGALEKGKQLHVQIKDRGLAADVVVGNCLVDMYTKCGSMEDARTVFESLSTKDVVTWTAMIAGYVEHGLGQKALTLYAGMRNEGWTAADCVTFVCLLQACTSVGALQQGRQLHAQIREKGLEANVSVGNCLVDMYAKCGKLQEARRVFDVMPTKDVVTWTALLNGYAEHGNVKIAMQCFEEMRQQRVEPNGATLTCLLVACSHEGLVAEGQQLFRMMVEDHGIVPTAHHYNCMIDLLGRSGRLDEAEKMLLTLPFETDVVGWTTLLSACKTHGDMERGGRCFDHLVRLEPGNGTSYALLANMYANAGRWKDADRVESLRKSAGAKKKPGTACIELQNTVHEFTVGAGRADISSKSRTMNLRWKEEGGHVPHTELVLKAVAEREKEDALCGHAEKLALAYGLLNTPDGTALLVTKNLRMCNDCHSGTKIMSKLEKREIVVRDAHRVHRFVDGSCSCGDRP